MKKPFQLCLVLLLVSMSNGLCYAQVRTFEKDGINYRVVSEPDGSMTTGTVHVCPLEYGVYEGDIVIPNAVKDNNDKYADKYKVVGIDADAFAKSQYLESVQLPPSIETIGENAFRFSSLNRVVLPIGNLTRISDYAFAQTKIESIDIPSTVKALGKGAFSDCFMLSQVVLHEGLSTIEDESFNGCGRLETLKLPNSLKSIGKHAFEKCYRLAKIELGSGLKGIGNRAFYGCVQLRSITLPEGLREIGDEAFAVSGIVEVTIPESIRVIKRGCFAGSMLRRVTLPKGLRSVEENAFGNCILDTLTPPEGAKVSELANNNQLRNVLKLQKISEETFTIPQRGRELAKILSNIEKKIDENNCLKVDYLNVDNWGTSEIRFSETTVISITIDGLTYMPISYPLSDREYGILIVIGGDSTLEKVVIPEIINIAGGPSPEKYVVAGIKVAAFYGNEAITYLELPNSICALGIGINTFYGDWSLTKCSLPNDMEIIPGGMFAYCGFQSIKFPRKLKEIGSEAFSAGALKKIIIPEGVTKIGAHAFSVCLQLIQIQLPESLVEIGRCCFNESNNIEKIIVPKNVKKIGRSAFDSDRLNYVEICGNPCDWDLSELYAFGNNIFGNNDQLRIVVKNAKYIECKALEQYSKKIEVK